MTKYNLCAGTVIAGCFEDRIELMNQIRYYGIRLDCLKGPEEELVIKQYYGTLEQIDGLLSDIDMDEWWREYYASTIAAWEDYQSGDVCALHHVGRGVESLLKPVVEVCRSAYMIENAEWVCLDKCGLDIKARADVVGVHQVLLWNGNRFIRCTRYGFAGLESAYSDKDWTIYDGTSYGVPYLIDTYGNGNAHNRLFVVEEMYDNLDTAKWDMQREDNFDYEQISRELFSGC